MNDSKRGGEVNVAEREDETRKRGRRKRLLIDLDIYRSLNVHLWTHKHTYSGTKI